MTPYSVTTWGASELQAQWKAETSFTYIGAMKAEAGNSVGSDCLICREARECWSPYLHYHVGPIHLATYLVELVEGRLDSRPPHHLPYNP